MQLKNIDSVSVGGCRRIHLAKASKGLYVLKCKDMNDEEFLSIYHYNGVKLNRLYKEWYGDDLEIEKGNFVYENTMPETEPVIVDLYKLEM